MKITQFKIYLFCCIFLLIFVITTLIDRDKKINELGYCAVGNMSFFNNSRTDMSLICFKNKEIKNSFILYTKDNFFKKLLDYNLNSSATSFFSSEMREASLSKLKFINSVSSSE